ncbi:MAG: GNAT family N-acetyltransferase [Chloroflexi bacterium]|nr:GNAT family N-acetyltransferase [Chloroflexota bacterium]
MAILKTNTIIRPAAQQDYSTLSRFINHEAHVHRHLDWRSPLEWLGYHPFFVVEENRRISAALACPPDPPDFAWIRLFAFAPHLSGTDIFQSLLHSAFSELPNARETQIVAIAIQDWFISILEASGFTNPQSIVVLEWNGRLPPQPATPQISIRTMTPEDLEAVARVDNTSFEPMWCNTLQALSRAYFQSGYATVAEIEDGIVGYQISTAAPLSAHLARLAVLPTYQGMHIGFALVNDLLEHFRSQGIWRITVNTQDDNHASLALYERIGFRRTTEVFPVYKLGK